MPRKCSVKLVSQSFSSSSSINYGSTCQHSLKLLKQISWAAGALDDPLNQTVYDPACPNGLPKENIHKKVIYMDAFPKSDLTIK
jgi:hypothetical protein